MAACLAAVPSATGAATTAPSVPPPKPFEGQATQWHDGFARYDFVMDAHTMAITPLQPPGSEHFAIGAPAPGQRRCVVVVPRTPAPGNPWSWRGCYWDHQPQTEVELLRRGFHVAYISAGTELRPDRAWEAWYAFLTDGHGLSRRPAFVGMSRGGEFAYTWAVRHPEQVGCIYADNPGTNVEVLSNLVGLVQHDVPLLHVVGSIDPLLGRSSDVIEATYGQLGGRISVMVKDGWGHHPHSLADPKPLADWIEANVNPTAPPPPAFAGPAAVRTSYYGTAATYRSFPEDGAYITCRGAAFAPCYDRYAFALPGVDNAVSVIVPRAPAAGNPWVYRAAFVDRDATVDLALLARGFHVVTGPVSYNADGPKWDDWAKVYQHLTAHGFSRKPVLEGAGCAAGEAYAWAIQHPDEVSCIYGENPVLMSKTYRVPLVDHLDGLAGAGVPILHVVGTLDPNYADHTKAVAARYESLGGHLRVIAKEGQGHLPSGPTDPDPVVRFILDAQR